MVQAAPMYVPRTARVRFALSPLSEAIASLRLLAAPGRQTHYRRWVGDARARITDLDLSILLPFARAQAGCIPDFIAPPPHSPVASFDDELAALRDVSHEIVRDEAARCLARTGDATLAAFVDNPRFAIDEVTRALRQYWERVLKPDWNGIRAVLEEDLLARSRQLALYGSESLLTQIDKRLRFYDPASESAQLHDSICWDNHTLDRWNGEMLLVPSVFGWGECLAVTSATWRPTIIYPARPFHGLCRTTPAEESLCALVGSARARLLLLLAEPRTTTEAARHLALTPGAASQVIGKLHGVGMLDRRRIGHRVYYSLSERGVTLLALLRD